MSELWHHELRQRIEKREYTVAILGMGYVGLPLAIAFVRAGFRTLGLDVDARKAALIRKGESYLRHIDVSPLTSAMRFSPSWDLRSS